MPYCNSLTRYSRYNTREIKIGNLTLGGGAPIRIQSMTTTDTMDTISTVEQSIRMIEAGCELVRITAPSLKEAQNLENIKKELRKRGYTTPLVADIHYTPNAAELAARIVEKVRVNPGNYADKKRFQEIEYSDESYQAELERIRSRFLPLIRICREYGTAMRIGTNHGSLSDRIMSRYGDTPVGMVESALEFVRICEEENYRNIVLSMKASNTQIMVQAYRLLVKKMEEESMNYPLHLGVTEAGEGEDGRIKSAAGIGTLLEDGLGDTIRVSLTEEPEREAPVAITLVRRYINRHSHASIPEIKQLLYNPFEYRRRKSTKVLNTGGTEVPGVVADFSGTVLSHETLAAADYHYSKTLDKWNIGDRACDFIYTGSELPGFALPGTLKVIADYDTWKSATLPDSYPLLTATQFCNENKEADIFFLRLSLPEMNNEILQKLKKYPGAILVLFTQNEHAMPELRRAFHLLLEYGLENPAVIEQNYCGETACDFQLFASTDAGGLLLDGFGDGTWIKAENQDLRDLNNTSFGILQATRTRISKTEYISCPSCGRTLFDLQETTARIRRRTDHLKGVKIGIMGCIVNGPGEMADADYGYVGTGPGKITLYRGKTVVKKNIGSEEAVDALIQLIKEDSRWVEKE